MNIKQFRERLTHNFIEKLVCFVIALGIYFYHNISTLGRKTFTVPLVIKSYGGMTAATSTGAVRYVKVSLRGRNDQLAGITENDLEAYVDISTQTKAGSYDFPVYVLPDERLMLVEPLELTSVPETVRLDIEEDIVRYVPVSLLIAGTPAHGYEQAGVSFKPTTVKVSGPKSIVESMESVQTEVIDVDGMDRDNTVQVFTTNKNRLVSVDTKTPVQVTVSIAPLGGSKEIKAVRIGYDNLSDALEITSMPYTVGAVVEGKQLVIEKLKDNAISATVDCSAITAPGTYELPVFIFVPSGVQVSSQTVDSVAVTFAAKEIEEPEEEEAEEL